MQSNIENLTEEEIQALRESYALKTKEQVLEVSKQKPFFIRLLSVDERRTRASGGPGT